MKIFNQYVLFLFILGLSLVSCNSIRVYSDFDSEIDFSSYQSFAFYKTGVDKVEISDIDKKRILKSIEENLTQKGMSISETPDLLINISTKSSENIYIDNSYYSPYYSGWYPYYGRNYRRVAHTTSEGVLYIDIIDTKSKQLVWQGKGIGFLSSNRMNRDELVEGYVNKILSVYPPQEEVSVN
ncbi:MAG: DUF4136 domain-containing protein [Flavobacteriaceae bacterium]|jgi:hypothetical protein|nr:DUF4136 domain-containing protein [Pelagibacterales bacterium]MBT6169437.1 DUF4136 domain-containing protein [Flavobacteriaceae bacterium]MDG1830692.1 DUF4136 domain-containing protein [Flavobacteriaceae bacterium]